jgi:hypothetical protein
VGVVFNGNKGLDTLFLNGTSHYVLDWNIINLSLTQHLSKQV